MLTAKHPRVLVTKDTLYIFALKTKQEELEQDDQVPVADEEDVAQERLDKLNNETLVHVMDVQTFSLMDFEFLQRLQSPPRTFVIQAYNKSTKQVDTTP